MGPNQLSGQMHGVVLCDEAGDAAAPGDPLGGRPCRRSAGRAGLRTRQPGRPGFAGPILAWLAAHEPDVLERARWALQPKDWLRLALGCPAATEPSDASATLLWDADADAPSAGPLLARARAGARLGGASRSEL